MICVVCLMFVTVLIVFMLISFFYDWYYIWQRNKYKFHMS